MANSDEVFFMVESIAEETSSKAKVALVKEYSDSDLFVTVLKYAYEPLIKFGVTAKMPETTGVGRFTMHTIRLLDKLINRELTGNDAVRSVENEQRRLTPSSSLLFTRIINKDLRANISIKSINKAIPGLLSEAAYMRCSLPHEVDLQNWNWSLGVFSQLKADGMFVNINTEIDPDKRKMLSRKYQEFPKEPFKELWEEIDTYLTSGFQYHGELTVYRNGVVLSRKEGNGILNSVRQGGSFALNEKPHLTLWDRVPLHTIRGVYACKDDYSQRWLNLLDELDYTENNKPTYIHLSETEVVFSLEAAYRHKDAVTKRKLEGTVVKHPHGLWKNHTSKHQVKLKDEFECDLRVKSYIAGTGKNEHTFGSLLCESECGELLVAVSGFTDEERLETDWIGNIIHVKFNSIIDSKSKSKTSLFLPRFNGKRFDLDYADTLEDIYRIVEETNE